MCVMLSHWIRSTVAVLKEETNSLAMDATFFHSVVTPMNFVFHAAYTLHEYHSQPLFFLTGYHTYVRHNKFSLGFLLQTQEEQVLKLKIAKPSTSGTYLSVFDFCAGRCRHNSESVVHENAYVSDFHHCFSLPSNSSALGMKRKNGVKSEKKERNRGNWSTISPVEARLNGINVVIGSIQKYMSCKGACLASVGPDQPAEVVDDAPKNLEHACILEHNQCYLVMVLIGIPGDFVPVHSASPWLFIPEYFLKASDFQETNFCIGPINVPVGVSI
ncbi:hypothetical protein Gohar_026772 [Gossypium harknessii]|uniref:SREBP regulating gene protein n=1 Tax=Gossypium harknessii TaxID=34285 RepID=A0A7J9HT93_9ROSI|nr:hypothetical protein [Gossypium harknessii]